MILRRLLTRSFRNLVDEAVDFHPSVNLFVGDNGQGKTNLLEAIHLLATTKSFRVARTDPMVRFGAESLFVEGRVETDGLDRTISIGVGAGSERRRELLFNGQKTTPGEYIRVLPVVAYSSSQLEIVRGGPEWRRRFVDRAISGIDPHHLGHLNRYTRVVRQRNALLSEISRRRAAIATLDAWDTELIEAARPIIEARARYIGLLESGFREVVEAHDYHVRDLAILWSPAGLVGDPAIDAENLRRERTRELAIGHTRSGPHRDSIEFLTGGRPAVEVLSSGEVKMTVLFLAMATLERFRQKWDATPLFLLDDLDAELDLSIVRRLTRYLAGLTQIFTTSPKGGLVEALEFGARREFLVRGGAVRLEREIGV